MCFSKGGILVEEFEKIFNDIFGSRSEDYKKIIRELMHGSLEQSEICNRLETSQTGGFSKTLLTLQQCGFISRDYVWNGKQKRSKSYQYRLKDNYLRFYLNYIEPKKDLINQGLYHDLHLEQLPEWQMMMGLQFENLVLNNLESIQHLLQIAPASILSASPYFQRKTARINPCQIDLLIQTKYTIYVCEIKFRKQIPSTIIGEVKEKIKKLKVSKTMSIRPVLIYEGTLATAIPSENFFSHMIPFEQLLKG